MKVKFHDHTEKMCTAPVEQKLFRSIETPQGWLLSFSLIGEIASNEIEELLTVENISELVFMRDDGSTICSVEDYDKVSSCVIRHAESEEETRTDVQFTKGV